MENATKALLIAAAILIAILVISLGLVAYNIASQQMQSANFSEAEIAQFNGKFTAYEGENRTAADINALLNTVLTHNSREAQEDGTNYVEVEGTAGIALSTAATSIDTRATSGYYHVYCEYGNGSLITSVHVDTRT